MPQIFHFWVRFFIEMTDLKSAKRFDTKNVDVVSSFFDENRKLLLLIEATKWREGPPAFRQRDIATATFSSRPQSKKKFKIN
jgi:hypothetical protein